LQFRSGKGLPLTRKCLPVDEDKLKWAFKLYDMDNNGVIDIKEMAAIIETLDCIEGVKPGQKCSQISQ
jgi:hypothetical protein